MRTPSIIAMLFLAGCGCEQKFAPGEIVKHRLVPGKFLVVRSSEVFNIEGSCLVDVRVENGTMWTVDMSELER